MAVKRALVTGASEGIGRELALRLAREGYGVTVVARSGERLRSLLGELAGEGHDIIEADLASDGGVEMVAGRVGEVHYDLLVNNAGFGAMGPFATADMDRIGSMLRLNIDCVVRVSHAFLQNAKSGDALVNVSSMLSFMATPGNGVYAATKAFVTSFSEALWYENRKRGVYVMALCPGATHSKFAERAGFNESDIPSIVMQNAAQVVDATMNGLKARKKPTVISGPINKGFGLVSRMLSRRTMATIIAKQM